ncbi:MAG: response regulator [Deltaproteobacteria bacterium]|nr:response regulator [Deltaproteobacteria bacterium]
MSFRILIADDEPLIRIDLRESLEGLGYKVVGEARDGREALDLIGRIHPDVAILDIKMPQMDGITVAKKVASRLPVILLTAYSDKNLIKGAREAGVMAYLTKPFREKDLTPAIELAIRHFLEESSLNERVKQLSEQLETRKLVERAKGLLMKAHNLSEGEAYRRIQQMSMKKNKPMKEVAEAVILMLE